MQCSRQFSEVVFSVCNNNRLESSVGSKLVWSDPVTSPPSVAQCTPAFLRPLFTDFEFTMEARKLKRFVSRNENVPNAVPR